MLFLSSSQNNLHQWPSVQRENSALKTSCKIFTLLPSRLGHFTVRISVGFLFTVKVQLQMEEILCKKLQLVCIKIFYFDLSREKLR